jgi:hypothetical protein
MELEPDFSRLSFDMSQFEVERQPHRDSPAGTFGSSAFDLPFEARVGDPFPAHNSSELGFLDLDSNLIDLSSFFEDPITKISPTTTRDVTTVQADGLLTNDFMPSGDETSWLGVPQDIWFQASDTCRQNGADVSFEKWPELSAVNACCLFPETNPFPNATLRGCGLEPPESCRVDSIRDITCQHPLDEYNHIDNLDSTYYTEDSIYTRFMIPDIVAPNPAHRMSSPQPEHSKSQTTDYEHDILKAVDIDGLQAPFRPTPKFGDLINSFDLNPKPPPSKRKRSSFTRAGKEKVRLVRDWGACVFCRSRKVSVSGPSSWSPINLTSISALQKKYVTNADERSKIP